MTRTLYLWVADQIGSRVVGAGVLLADVPAVTNVDGWCQVTIAADLEMVSLVIRADGYDPYTQTVTLKPLTRDISVGDTQQTSPDHVQLPPMTRWHLGPIHADGVIFRDEDDAAWIVRGMSGFRDYDRYRRGEDIRPLLQEAHELGANQRRVFFCVDSFAKIDPKVAGFYDKIPAFLDTLAEYGLYCELTGGDYQIMLPTVEQQRAHLQALVKAVGERPAFIEGSNEAPKNGFYSQAWHGVTYGPNVLTCLGSPLSDSNPLEPFREWCSIHPRRDWPKWQLAGQDGYWATYGWREASGSGFIGCKRPVVINEPMGAAEVDQPGRRSTDAGAFERLARDIATWSAGGTFHSDDGIQSVLLKPTQRACAEGFFRGLGIV